MKLVDLEANKLNGTIPAGMFTLTALEELQMGKNSGIVGTIPTLVGLLTSLKLLGFSDNDLSGTIPTEIGLTNMTRLQLKINRLNGTIPEEVYGLTNLDVIELNKNAFSGTISTRIGKLPLLRRAVFLVNQFVSELRYR